MGVRCRGLSLMSAAGAALWAAELEGVGSRSPSKLYQGANAELFSTPHTK